MTEAEEKNIEEMKRTARRMWGMFFLGAGVVAFGGCAVLRLL